MSTSSKVLDKTMTDSLGNDCRIQVYQAGPVMCEVWMRDFNSAVPRRFYGTAMDCQLHAELWISHKQKDGFNY